MFSRLFVRSETTTRDTLPRAITPKSCRPRLEMLEERNLLAAILHYDPLPDLSSDASPVEQVEHSSFDMSYTLKNTLISNHSAVGRSAQRGEIMAYILPYIEQDNIYNVASYDWLVHLDRQVVSPAELLKVSGFPPGAVTRSFVPMGGLRPKGDGAFVPFFLEDQKPPANSPTPRMFEFEFPSSSDVANVVNPSSGSDSIWIDLGAPIQVTPDGRAFKPLFAFAVLDLDNRINVNVHGNVMRSGDHGSAQGWGRWEISLAQLAVNIVDYIDEDEIATPFTGDQTRLASRIHGRHNHRTCGEYRRR